jgi:ATP-dependent DNA helicase RecG
LTVLPGLGKARIAALSDKRIFTRLDLLLSPPSGYQDRRKLMSIPEAASMPEGTPILIFGKVIKTRLDPNGRYFLAELEDGLAKAVLWWFKGLRWIEPRVKVGRKLTVHGASKLREGHLQLSHPEYWIVPDDAEPLDEETRGVFPVYEAIGGLPGMTRRKIVYEVISKIPPDLTVLPPHLLEMAGLKDPLELLKIVHFPPKDAKGALPKPKESRAWLTLGTYELMFWRLTIVSAKLKSQGEAKAKEPNPALWEAAEKVWGALPFEASPEQRRATREILDDLQKPFPMNRLLQGEVGSGKTAVAACAAAAAAASGRQAALMAPTEILASQHLSFFKRLSQAIGLETRFLTGRTPRPERQETLSKMASGAPLIVVGTQALASEASVFGNLGLAVIDEQHRFGVRQRLSLRSKSPEVNLLSLTATPIPGSLAGILYGDLDLSSMRGTLPGRECPVTVAYACDQVGEARGRFIESLRRGGQGFLICPRIGEDRPLEALTSLEEGSSQFLSGAYANLDWDGDADWDTEAEASLSLSGRPKDEKAGKRPKESPLISPQTSSRQSPAQSQGKTLSGGEAEGGEIETQRPDLLAIAKLISSMAPDLSMGVLHGRLAPDERAGVMESFRRGELQILAATTMVEVGVDVPAANVMLVEGAEFFGLAQLHQLRGRIGRGGGASLFLAAAAGPLSETSAARLKALCLESDGYALAELDLKLRGPGEELGLRQSGWPKLRFAKLPARASALPDAMSWADKIWSARDTWPPSLSQRLEEMALKLAEASEDAPEPPGRKAGGLAKAKGQKPEERAAEERKAAKRSEAKKAAGKWPAEKPDAGRPADGPEELPEPPKRPRGRPRKERA